MWTIGSRLLVSPFISLYYIAMVTIIICDVIIFIVGIFIWVFIKDQEKLKKINDLEYQLQCAESGLVASNAELEWQKLARKAQTKKYDDLYAHMLAVNAQNAKLQKQLSTPSCSDHKVDSIVDEHIKAQLLTHSFSKEMWSAVYNLFLRGATRKEIANRYGVSYANVCKIIRERDRKQDPLF